MSKKTKQLSTENSTGYITKWRTLADPCEYSEMENEIRDHFVTNYRSKKLQKALLRKQNLTLTKIAENFSKWRDSTRRWHVEHEKFKDPLNKLSKTFYKEMFQIGE